MSGHVSQPLLVFHHIMKTGGTSVMTLLREVLQPTDDGHPRLRSDLFIDDLAALPETEFATLEAIAGHLPFESAALVPRRVVRATVLREPVERTLSHYWQIRRDPGVMQECGGELTLEEFLTSERWHALASDYQARQLAHRVGLPSLVPVADRAFASLGDPFPPSHPLPLQSYFDCSPLCCEGAELAAAARESLDDCVLVGVTDDLDAFMAGLAALLDVPVPPALPRANQAAARVRAEDLSPVWRARIEELNRVDRVLVAEARVRTALAGRPPRLLDL